MPAGKNFSVFTLESDRPCLDWQSIWFLNSWPISDPFKLQPKWRQKCKIWLWCQFYHRTVNHRKISNAPLDAPMCPLQIFNDIEPLSSTLHGLNACFINQPPSTSIFSKSGQFKKNWNVLLDSLTCALQIINDIESLTLTLHGVNVCFICHPSKSKITWLAISWKPLNPPPKSSTELHIFTPLNKFLGQNSK